MGKKLAIVCPHCGSTGTYEIGIQNGSTGVQCKQCKKNFRVYMQNGEIKEVKKN